jgi:hypothetical protein
MSEQTLEDIEFVIVDDGSTDETYAILAAYRDRRFRLVRNAQNIGLTRSLNKGLQVARGEYVARMDADDVSSLQRLEKQVATLQRTGADLCFVRCRVLDETRDTQSEWTELSWDLMRWRGLFGNSYGMHSGVMFRRRAILDLGGYDEAFPRAQDYELWDRCAAADLAFVYTPEILLTYRLRAQGISRRYLAEQEDCARQVSYRAIRRLLPDATLSELDGLRWLFLPREQRPSVESVRAALCRCEELVEAFVAAVAPQDAGLIRQDVSRSLAGRLRSADVSLRYRLLSVLGRAVLRTGSIRYLVNGLSAEIRTSIRKVQP